MFEDLNFFSDVTSNIFDKDNASLNSFIRNLNR